MEQLVKRLGVALDHRLDLESDIRFESSPQYSDKPTIAAPN